MLFIVIPFRECLINIGEPVEEEGKLCAPFTLEQQGHSVKKLTSKLLTYLPCLSESYVFPCNGIAYDVIHLHESDVWRSIRYRNSIDPVLIIHPRFLLEI